MGFILQSDYVFNSNSSTGLNKVPVNARVRIGFNTYVLVKEVTSTSMTIQQGIDGGYLLAEQKGFISSATSINYIYLLVPNTITNPYGDLRVRCYDSSGNFTCSFTLSMLGVGLEEFKITKCIYSKTLKSSRVSSSYGGLFYGGFGLLQNSNGIYFSVVNNSKCYKVEVEYSDCNFVPTLTQTSFLSPSSTNKIYAIREGGGTFIQDLGCIKNNYRLSGTSAGGESLEFYLFSNGFVRWTSAMTLNGNYFHQWANGNFGSLNIDSSDKYLCNVGTNAGQTLGVIKGAELPNIKGKYLASAYISPDTAPVNSYYRFSDQSIAGGELDTLNEGVFFDEKINKSELDRIFKARNPSYTTPSGWQGAGVPGSFVLRQNMNSSRASSIYKDGGKVFGDCIPNYLVVQAF